MPTGLSGSTKGALWMTLSSFLFAITYVAVRELSETLTSFEVVFYRASIALLACLPWLIRTRAQGLRTRRMKDYVLRALAAYIGMVSWFFALANLPLATATSLSFTMPFFTVMFAALLIGETVGWARWAGIAAGFVGVLVVVRPGMMDVGMPVIAVLFTAVCYGYGNCSTRSLALTEDANASVFYLFALIAPLALGPAIWFFTMPTWADVPWILVLGLVTAVGQLCFTRALTVAPTSVAMPFFYMQLPCTALLGFLFYAERPDIWIWVGAAIIAGSGYVIARRESTLERAGERASRAS